MDMSELTEYFSQEETMALTDVLIERDKQREIQVKETIALNLLRRQTALADVAEITGLSIEQVQQLQTQN
jgi:hypothetical protein